MTMGSSRNLHGHKGKLWSFDQPDFWNFPSSVYLITIIALFGKRNVNDALGEAQINVN